MENNFLGREDAPIGPGTWKALDRTMAEAAKGFLTGRRMLHLEGPYGFGLKSVPLQDSQPEEGIAVSSFVPVSLIHRTFSLSKRDLAAAEKDGMPINTTTVASAAIAVAMMEDSLIFEGMRGIPGLLTSKGASELKLSHWFTSIVHPGVEPTNNRAERALREHVVLRKIVGTLRNGKDALIHESTMTVLATWEQEGLNKLQITHTLIL
ncbi:Encapsulating protein for peroxidase [uncultured archaeon]|nr:Encapsulating protein for peroxidase [uncultured archaeon]